jgi:thiaminase/transcriptional activator TenA
MSQWLVSLAILGLLVGPQARTFTDELWEENLDIYQEILDHSFLTGLSEGTLRQEAFSFYMIQDAHYLREFARALSIAASKAPREEWAALLNRHAVETLEYEKTLHEGVFAEYGISTEQVAHTDPAPAAFAYTNFLVVTAYSRPFAESLSALLPCYWIYWEVGKELKKKGSKDPLYQRWIDAYSSEEYADSVKAILEIVNQSSLSAGRDEIQRMKEHFRRSARYEWMFWDSAYQLQAWPLEEK